MTCSHLLGAMCLLRLKKLLKLKTKNKRERARGMKTRKKSKRAAGKVMARMGASGAEPSRKPLPGYRGGKTLDIHERYRGNFLSFTEIECARLHTRIA